MEMLDRDGHPNRRELVALILVFGKHIETLEQAVEDIYLRLDLLEGKKPLDLTKAPEIKLRTPADIANDLSTRLSLGTKVFYLSAEDWKILEKQVNMELAGSNTEYGYGKETDPRDFKEKVCLFYKGLPVFKE